MALAVKTIVAASLLLTATVAATVTISRTAALVAVGDDRPSTIPANGPAEQIKVGANAEEATDALPPGALFRLGNGRFRHEGWNKNVAYAANGKVLVTCSERSLKIWDAKTGKLLRQAPLADSIHRAMRVFADGKRLATLGGRIGKGTEPFGTWWLRVWDVETAEVVSEISHSRISFGEMRALAISPDGTLAFLGDSTGSIYIYELATGLKMLQYRVADLRDVNGIALSPDGQIAAITTGSNQLFLWHWSSGDDLVQLQSGRRYLGVAFSPDGKRLAVGSDSRNDVQVWDIATRRLLQTLEDTPKVPLLVEELAFTPDGTKLAAANCVMLSNQFAAAVLIWDLASGKLVHRFAFQGMHPRSLSLSPDGRSIAAVDWDVGFRVWDIETGHSRGNATAGHSGSIRAMLYSPTSGEIVTASSDRTARIWDARTGREIAKLDHDAEVFALAQSADGRLLATATQNDTISLWESSPVQKLRTIKRGGRSLGGTVSLAFASDGRELLALEDDLHLCICGVADGSIRREIELRPSGMNLAVEGGEDVREVAMRLVTAHAFTSDSSKFVLAGSEGFWWTFDAKSGGEIARHILPVQPRTIAIDPGSRHIAFAGGTRHDAGATDKIASDIEKTAELVVLDFDTGKAVWRAQRQDPYWRPNGFGPLRFSNDGIWIAVAVRGHEGPEIELYDAATGQRRKQLAGGDPAGWSNQGLAFSTDGSRLASIQADATVLIWNLTAIKK
ncbi:MAG: WD40 repeat domain-containing protein [Planctomycetaceae bacterium]